MTGHPPFRHLTVERRECLAQQYVATTAPMLSFAVHQRDPDLIAELIGGMGREQLLVLAVVLAEMVPNVLTRPDDGIVDLTAVRRVVAGEVIPLSRREKVAAVHLMHAAGVANAEIASRLHIGFDSVRRWLLEPFPQVEDESLEAVA
jgi:hypothetical protein